MTMRKQDLRKNIDARLDRMDAVGLRSVLDFTKKELGSLAGNYLFFSRDVLVDRTRDLAEKPMHPQFGDAIAEAFSIVLSPEEIKEIKKQARIYNQAYKTEEATAWAQQFMLVRRTKPYDSRSDSSTCKICGANSLHDVIMLQIGLRAGPFCKKCLRRIPKSWYCQR